MRTLAKQSRFAAAAKQSRLAAAATLGALAVLAVPATGTADDDKPYSIVDGAIDWYTFNGYRRYHSECHVCHGPDGLGSSFAPALVDTIKSIGYDGYAEVVVNGKEEVSQANFRKMPSFGTNLNVMCFLDDIYAYLVARADGAVGRGRPAKKQPKSEEAKERDDACMG